MAKAQKYPLLVFDLDGTVIDSKLDIANAVRLSFSKHAIPSLPPELIERHIGTGVGPLIRQTAVDAEIDPDRVTEDFQQFYLDNLTTQTALYDGILDVLDRFKDTPKIILTNKSNVFLIPLVKAMNLDRHFIAFYGRESFATCKPDALPLLNIAHSRDVSIENTLMIGDTETDILTGKNAGSMTCAATYGYGAKETLAHLHPAYSVNHPLELIECIEALSKNENETTTSS